MIQVFKYKAAIGHLHITGHMINTSPYARAVHYYLVLKSNVMTKAIQSKGSNCYLLHQELALALDMLFAVAPMSDTNARAFYESEKDHLNTLFIPCGDYCYKYTAFTFVNFARN